MGDAYTLLIVATLLIVVAFVVTSVDMFVVVQDAINIAASADTTIKGKSFFMAIPPSYALIITSAVNHQARERKFLQVVSLLSLWLLQRPVRRVGRSNMLLTKDHRPNPPKHQNSLTNFFKTTILAPRCLIDY
jgi:hypothetical protein